MPDHSCFGKAREIRRRTNEELDHDEVSELCRLWRCRDPEDFYAIMNTLTNDQLREEIAKVRKKKRTQMREEEISIYA